MLGATKVQLERLLPHFQACLEHAAETDSDFSNRNLNIYDYGSGHYTIGLPGNADKALHEKVAGLFNEKIVSQISTEEYPPLFFDMTTTTIPPTIDVFINLATPQISSMDLLIKEISKLAFS